MSLRWEFTRDGRFNVPYKVEIYDTEFSGSSTVLDTIGNVPVEVEMGTKNADPLEKIKGSSITVRLWGSTGDFNDLFDRNNERFLIKLYINGTHEADFIPIPDMFQDYEEAGEYTFEIKAANLALFRQYQIDDIFDTYWATVGAIPNLQTRIGVIDDIIGELFTIDVVDGVVFQRDGVSSSSPSLFNQYVNPQRLKGLTLYEALELLIPKGHQMRMSRGKIFILPVTEASFVGWDDLSSTTYNDNFVSTKIGGRLSKSRTRLQTYDGVRRFYEPLEADNVVPSGEFELEDFGLTESDIGSSGETEALPQHWSATRGLTGSDWDTYAKLVSGGAAWKIPEAKGNFVDQSSIEAGGTNTWESWSVDSGQVVAGTRLKIDLSFNYVSINRFAHLPIKIKVGSKVLFRGRTISGNLVAGTPEWQDESDGSVRHVDHVLIGARANTGYRDWSFLTPPVPETGSVTVEIETPSVDRGYESRSSAIVGNYVEISSLSIDPSDEDGELLVKSDILAGSTGDVYEYTEGFGDGFTQFNAGAIYDGSSSSTRGLTDSWYYNGNDENVSTDSTSLADLESSYLASQLTTDRDKLTGTLDVYDFIALIDGYRVNYIRTDFRYGRSDIELIEIRDHDIEATVEERKEKKDTDTGNTIDDYTDNNLWNYNQLRAIGELAEDVSAEVTEVGVELDTVVRSGYEYWIVNENELSREDRDAGKYAILPAEVGGETTEYGPGLLDGDTADKLDIESQYINAPKGSLLFKAPGQEELNQVFNEEIVTGVVRVQKEGDIGVLNEEIGSGGSPPGSSQTTIDLKEIPATIELEDNQTLQIYTEAGLIEGVVVDGDQTITAGTDTVTIDSKTFSNYYANGGAKIREPGYSASSRLTNNISATSTNLTSITSLNSHTNIGGGTAYSSLTLKNSTDTNADGVATNASSIASLETHTNIDGGSSYSALTLKSRTDTNENDISTNASAILTAESNISDLQTDSSHVFRQNSAPSQRPSGESLVEGDIWIETDDNDKQHYWTGSSWVVADATASLNLDTRVSTNDGRLDTVEATAVLKVDASGNLASVALEANHDGSSININADQIDINNITFDKSAGTVGSDNYSAGSSGWQIEGNGDAEFNDVRIRGSGSKITDNAELENLSITGTLLLDGGVLQNSSANTKFNSQGITLDGSGSFTSASSLTITDGFDDFEMYGSGLLNEVFLEAKGSWNITLQATGNKITLDSSSIELDSNNLGFYGATSISKQTLSGSSFGGSQVLKDLVIILEDLGLITNNTTP